jgi:hypothetical protein
VAVSGGHEGLSGISNDTFPDSDRVNHSTSMNVMPRISLARANPRTFSTHASIATLCGFPPGNNGIILIKFV